MASRLKLQEVLEEMLGSRNVYYDPPTNVTMKYDAIRFSLATLDSRFADDRRYINTKCYNLIVISRLPDPEVVDKILELPYSSIGKPYVADNLNHYPITLYF